MSGHSKWHKIRHTKAINDQKKSKEFARFSREIQITARSEKDPAKNAALRDAIARAKKANMPQANIDRLLSQKDESTLQEVTYEGFGPGGAGIFIVAHTDNPNRVVNNVRQVFRKHGFDLGSPGSVRWKFNETFEPLYPLQLSDADKAALASLVSALEDTEEVSIVYTDTAE